MTAEAVLLEAVPRKLLIGGAWVDGETAATFDVHDPATDAVLCAVADATANDAVAALDAACAAAEHWRATAPRERSDVLRRAHELVAQRSEDLALLMTLEMGKPLDQARGEVGYANAFVRWYAEEAVRIGGRYGETEDGTGRILTTKQPVGPCLFVTPWNFPLAMGARKIAPALAAGCTVVVKPAKQTPLSTLAFAEILESAGLPPGVVNIVTTWDSAAATGPLIADPRLRKLSFTGSTDVGRRLLKLAADQVLRVSMELGGNAPFLVFEDADIAAAVDGAMIAKMRNMGEACTAANRFLVHRSIAEEFAERLSARMDKLVVDRGTVPGAQVGPLIDAAAVAEIDAKLREAQSAGARLRCGGAALDRPGTFYTPTVLTDVPRDARLLTEETFGPIAPITTFDDEDEAIALANDTPYGLAAYLYTREIGRVLRVGERLEAGMVGVNQGMVSNAAAPFGGIKHSGLGREGGPEGLDEYLETKYLALNPA
jgi:succinate-semialdehyde dehydrogenase/glutarate-semialdehyde dehydrogenase